MFGKLNAEEIENVLTNQMIGRIGCTANNTTYIVPVSYAYDEDYVYCHTHKGLKIDMMRNNPNVCFEVDTMENMANWKSVIAWGIFEELTEIDKQKVAIKKLYNRVVPAIPSKTLQLSPQWPFPPDDLEDIQGIIFRIKLDKKSGRFEKSEALQFCGI
jgi:nitroimidazol reductase NimA-like FMN-containing flavoprotein (pyridoxamine 5'-phosphate oxidase superfamily)